MVLDKSDIIALISYTSFNSKVLPEEKKVFSEYGQNPMSDEAVSRLVGHWPESKQYGYEVNNWLEGKQCVVG